MKWTLSLLFVASVATALPANKEGKAFSLFSVVTFPNDECTTAMAPPLPGICITAEECTNTGGQASGNCASGFGVCCFRSQIDAGTITNDVTHITSTGFPAVVGNGPAPVTAANLVFPIQGGANICQTRLDFQTGVFSPPINGAANGLCGGANGDAITVTSPATTLVGFNSLCGTLTGQHIYIDNNGGNPAATLTIATGTGVFGRSWRILVRMIECDCPFDAPIPRAPPGCLQFHTGQSGQITSFNGALAANAQMMIGNLAYSVCIRPLAGNNCVVLREARSGAAAMPDSFFLDQGAIGGASVSGNAAGVPFGPACTTEAIIFPDNLGTNTPRFCGGVLAPVTTETVAAPIIGAPRNFQVGVIADDRTGTASAAGSGFDLIYNQVPC